MRRPSEQLIVDYPLAAVGGAFAIGLLAGWSGGRGGRVSRAIAAALSGLVVTLVRDAVIGKLSGAAKSWVDERERRASETSHEPEVETFFEH